MIMRQRKYPDGVWRDEPRNWLTVNRDLLSAVQGTRNRIRFGDVDDEEKNGWIDSVIQLAEELRNIKVEYPEDYNRKNCDYESYENTRVKYPYGTSEWGKKMVGLQDE